MEKNVDALLLNNIVESLRSSDVDSVISTCAFLETVVVYDFSAEAFLQQRELLVVSFTLLIIAIAIFKSIMVSC